MAGMMLYKRVPGWRSRWVWEPQKGCSDNIQSRTTKARYFAAVGIPIRDITSADIFLSRTLFSTNLSPSFQFLLHTNRK